MGYLKQQFSYLIYYNNQMKELNLMLLILIFAVLTVSNQWFNQDSNLISASQFNSKIAYDKLSYKFVNYFTPHCPYCRHLKTVFDHLKHKKDWCFKIYDFNCQDDPQFCSRNLKSTSFPYTAVFDQNGQMIEQIHGFYPEPIITSTFDRIQKRCLEARDSAPVKTNQPKREVPQIKSAYQPITIGNNQQKSGKPTQQPKAKSLSKLPQQEKAQLNYDSHSLRADEIEDPKGDKKMERAQKKDNEQKSIPLQQAKQKNQATNQQQHTTTQSLPPNYEQLKTQSKLQHEGKDNQKPEGTASKIYHTYLFYGICLFCVSYYVYSLQTTPLNRNSNPEQRYIHPTQKKSNPHSKKSGEGEKEDQKDENLPSVQQNEQVEHVSDQEL